jgi:NAD(P)-dependent dehydrogenase (short-subunit alcohol dehydrogenase family)
MALLSFNLEDKVFVVTGGSRGIGLEIAKSLLEQKARAVICGRKVERLYPCVRFIHPGFRFIQHSNNPI